MEQTGARIDDAFQNDARKYADYLETPEGRLRLDLAFANLREFLPQGNDPLQALDLGCGTGAVAIRLARMGVQVTLLDSSAAMLEIADSEAKRAAVRERLTLQHADAAQICDLFEAGSFDVIVCHNVLEYVEDPEAVLCSAARLLRDASAIMSILVRTQAGEVLKAALKTGDLPAAERALTTEWGRESLYGGEVRLFTTEKLDALLKQAALAVRSRRGVRAIADYLPAEILADDYERILALERQLGKRREFADVARYAQCLASFRGAE